MKKLIILCFTILLSGTIAGSAVPIGLTILGGDGTSGGEGGGCTTANDEAIYSELVSDGSIALFELGSGVAGSWDPGSTVTITGYKWWVRDDEQIGSLVAELQTDSGSGTTPSGTPVAGTSATLGHASIDDATIAETWFELATPQSVDSASLWVVIRDDETNGGWTVSRDSSPATHAGIYAYDQGAGWGAASRDVKVEIWGCP